VLLSLWTYWSFTAVKGQISEWVCQLFCFYSFVFMAPVYFTIWYSIIFDGIGIVGALVLTNLLLPFIISLAESFRSAMLYFAFLPWFLVCGLFFLVFVPSYSFARLWDTTWGNRATGKDSAINDKTEDYMKRQNLFFSIFLLILNTSLIWAFAKLFMIGFTAMITFMFIVFSPMFIQMFCSFLYMFIILPIRKVFSLSQGKDKAIIRTNKKYNDLGIDLDDEETGIHDVRSQTVFMDAIFPTEATGENEQNTRELEELEGTMAFKPPTGNGMRHVYNEKNFWSVSTATSTIVSGVKKEDDMNDHMSVVATPMLTIKNLEKLASDLRANSVPSSPTSQRIQHASSNDSCCSSSAILPKRLNVPSLSNRSVSMFSSHMSNCDETEAAATAAAASAAGGGLDIGFRTSRRLDIVGRHAKV
jgi:hypothetical protein